MFSWIEGAVSVRVPSVRRNEQRASESSGLTMATSASRAEFDSFCSSISVGLSPTFCQTVASDVRHLSYATAYVVRGPRAVSRNHYRRYTATRLGRQL
jgi:hypothetical protein